MRSTLFLIVAGIALLVLPQFAAQSDRRAVSQDTVGQRRLALVIGNAKYEASALANPIHDAEDMKDALERVGFAVTIATDLSLRAMDQAISKFIAGLRKGDIA